MDEGYFTVLLIEQEKGICGRGAVGKQNVAVMAESTPLEDIETGETSKSCRYFKAKVLEDHTSEGINETVKNDYMTVMDNKITVNGFILYKHHKNVYLKIAIQYI